MVNIEKIFRFRQFPVYKEGRTFVVELKKITKNVFPKEEIFGLRSQLWRALDSILLNIAEGSDRGIDKDFARFLNLSQTSLNEVVSCLDVAFDNEYIDDEQHIFWLDRAGELSQQITAFRRHLLAKSNVKSQMSNVHGGFTLVETLIYIAVIGGVVSAFVVFALSITGLRNKTYVAQEVQANTRTAMDIITEKIRFASGVNTSTSVFGSDPGYLSLAMSSSTQNPTIIGLSSDDGVLQIKEGGSATTTIVADEVKITNLVFTNLTANSTRENIRVEMTAEYNNTSGEKEFDYIENIQTAVSLRQ